MEIYIAKSGKETGPFTEQQIASMLDSGMLTLTNLVGHKKLASLAPVGQLFDGYSSTDQHLPEGESSVLFTIILRVACISAGLFVVLIAIFGIFFTIYELFTSPVRNYRYLIGFPIFWGIISKGYQLIKKSH